LLTKYLNSQTWYRSLNKTYHPIKFEAELDLIENLVPFFGICGAVIVIAVVIFFAEARYAILYIVGSAYNKSVKRLAFVFLNLKLLWQ